MEHLCSLHCSCLVHFQRRCLALAHRQKLLCHRKIVRNPVVFLIRLGKYAFGPPSTAAVQPLGCAKRPTVEAAVIVYCPSVGFPIIKLASDGRRSKRKYQYDAAQLTAKADKPSTELVNAANPVRHSASSLDGNAERQSIDNKCILSKRTGPGSLSKCLISWLGQNKAR